MSYDCKVLADSIASGVRLTTLQVTFPRFVLAEFNTHRVFSRNGASSRAIPVEKRMELVLGEPFVPAAFERNQKGMQGGDALTGDDDAEARAAWLELLDASKRCTERMLKTKTHKHWANRPLDLFAWYTCIVTATEWENFFALRNHAAASPEMQSCAQVMKSAMAQSTPRLLGPGDWHLPLVDGDMGDFTWAKSRDAGLLDLAKVSCARCARVSYLTHEGLRDVKADLALHDRLLESGHMSPFEHAAQVSLKTNDHRAFIGNFRAPWIQYRKMLPHEDVFQAPITEKT